MCLVHDHEIDVLKVRATTSLNLPAGGGVGQNAGVDAP